MAVSGLLGNGKSSISERARRNRPASPYPTGPARHGLPGATRGFIATREHNAAISSAPCAGLPPPSGVLAFQPFQCPTMIFRELFSLCFEELPIKTLSSAEICRRQIPAIFVAARREAKGLATECGHSITSSALASILGGIVRPSDFAVLRFTVRLNL
jgi:hypothetical protein